MPGERTRFGGDAFLHIPFGGNAEHVMVKGRLPGWGLGVKKPTHVTLSVGETNGGCQPLTERAGGDLHALSVLVFGVPGG